MLKPTYLRVDDPTAVKWLQNLIFNSFKNAGSKPELLSSYKELTIWNDALSNPVSASEIAAAVSSTDLETILSEADYAKTVPKPKRGRPPTRATKASKPARKPKADAPDPFKCSIKEHQNRTFKQAPRDDCSQCWVIYKKFHPNEYDLKYAEMKRKQKAAKA